MESSATESLVAVGSEMDNISNVLMPTDDQCFLLYFIIGTYFAPDLKGESPEKSVLQRCAEGLPPYTSDQLVGSHIKTVEVERVYYYVLRKADKSVIVKLPWLRQFFHGHLPTPAVAYPQFDDLFPPHLHPHSRFKNRYKIIENIVFINNPQIFYVKTEDIERFKRLTGLEDFLLDRDCPIMHTFVDGEVLHNVEVQEVDFNGELPPPWSSCASQGTAHLSYNPRPEALLQHVHVVKPVTSLQYYDTLPVSNVRHNGTPPVSTVPHNGTTPVSSVEYNGTPLTFSHMFPLPTEVGASPMEKFGPGMIYLPSRPTREEWSNIITATKSGSALTGSAAMGQIGPVLGLMDIGECEDSYLFRVSLPGVKRDEREFGCEVESDGKVLIRGVTATGEKRVCRYSQVFEMQSQNLCPPGHFSISFKLPGPVDPQQFSGNFGTDGILEGIVMKKGQKI